MRLNVDKSGIRQRFEAFNGTYSTWYLKFGLKWLRCLLQDHPLLLFASSMGTLPGCILANSKKRWNILHQEMAFYHWMQSALVETCRCICHKCTVPGKRKSAHIYFCTCMMVKHTKCTWMTRCVRTSMPCHLPPLLPSCLSVLSLQSPVCAYMVCVRACKRCVGTCKNLDCNCWTVEKKSGGEFCKGKYSTAARRPGLHTYTRTHIWLSL